ncbi:MAG: rhodanese-like domain-containing protein [Microthrixaceae bacterium]
MAIEEISVVDLADRMESGLTVLDVREPDEVAEVRVPGVLPIPLGDVMARMGEIPEGELAIICKGGGRSMQACEQLAAAGRTVVNVAGGTTAWVEAGLPTEAG